MTIRIGHLSTFYHTAMLLMARTDLADALGERPEWRLFGTGPAIMQAFSRRELDLAYIGLPPAIIGIERGARVVCVAGGHVEGTVMAGRARHRDLAEAGGIEAVLRQFLGKRIGVPGSGSIHDVILRHYLETHRLEGKVEVRNYPWADLVTEAVASDEVDAAVGTPALAVAIKRFAGGRVLLPPSLLWPGNPSYGIVAEQDFLRDRTDMVGRFLIAHEDAEAILRNDPAAASELIAKLAGVVDREFVLETLLLSPRYCAQLTDGYISCTMEFVRSLKRLGYIGREVSWEEIFDTSLIRKVHPEGDHYGRQPGGK